MLHKPPVSCLIFTLNEEVNLPHCLRSLNWCDDVVVVDSFSRDRTEAIARAAGARFVQHEFTIMTHQWNWSLENIPLQHPWALLMDADERVTGALAAEMAVRLPATPADVGAFRLRRRFHLWGKWLRYSSLYPTWIVRLLRVGQVRFFNRGHGEVPVVDSRIEALWHDLIDENHKGLEDWWNRQERYAIQEARYELTRATHWRDLLSRDPMRRHQAVKSLGQHLPGRPFWFFLYAYGVRLGFLDGIEGLRFCAMKATYQAMIDRMKRDLRKSTQPSPG